MPHYDLQKALQSFPPVFNYIVTESVGEDLARQWWNGNPGRFPFQNITEVFKIGVASTNRTVLEFKGGDIGAADDFVVGVHASVGAVRLRIFHLRKKGRQG